MPKTPSSTTTAGTTAPPKGRAVSAQASATTETPKRASKSGANADANVAAGAAKRSAPAKAPSKAKAATETTALNAIDSAATAKGTRQRSRTTKSTQAATAPAACKPAPAPNKQARQQTPPAKRSSATALTSAKAASQPDRASQRAANAARKQAAARTPSPVEAPCPALPAVADVQQALLRMVELTMESEAARVSEPGASAQADPRAAQCLADVVLRLDAYYGATDKGERASQAERLYAMVAHGYQQVVVDEAVPLALRALVRGMLLGDAAPAPRSTRDVEARERLQAVAIDVQRRRFSDAELRAIREDPTLFGALQRAVDKWLDERFPRP
ncbi:MAG: hypothetical protein MUF54_09730 [Polyangiaceae bacterium]|jgi:hypothetical protein|nr:hypothetical protein [Polyangiaceae bacterium]